LCEGFSWVAALALGSNPEVSYMNGVVSTTMNSTYHLDTTFSKLL